MANKRISDELSLQLTEVSVCSHANICYKILSKVPTRMILSVSCNFQFEVGTYNVNDLEEFPTLACTLTRGISRLTPLLRGPSRKVNSPRLCKVIKK